MPDVPPSSSVRNSGVARWLRSLPRRDWTEYERTQIQVQFSRRLCMTGCAVISVSGFTVSHVLSYRDGCNAVYSPLPGLIFLVAFFFGLASAFWSLVALLRRDHVRTSCLTFLGLIVLSTLPIVLFHGSPFLLGLKHRVLSGITPDQLRGAAGAAAEMLHPPDPFLHGPGMYGQRGSQHDLIWERFSALPGVASLGPDIIVHSDEDGVDIYWDDGGWDTWQWGVRIAHPDKVRERQGDACYLDLQPDIALFMASH